ncbi:MAG: site-specific DNA-methyltransferase [Methanosarcinales archaeon]|uniref:Type II methyltransferase n=1 Tax=Candidatus Ethanoperedens thermophilum TaxID=2766897 RepID=A0A848D9S6_9EURY|nr:site-specific DNA-methyltransferase [Candidatus Ethanoperedens thermophilum]
MMEVDKVYSGDCIEIMKKLPEKSIDLIFADPPFNIGIKYDKYNDNLPYEDYYDWSKKWIVETLRLLKTHGSIYIAIGDEFAAEINIILKQTGYYFRNWIIWYYTFGQNQRKKFNRAHTHILYFTKDKEKFIFNPDDIRVPSARQLIYKDKRANPKGKIPDDVWQFSRVCGTFKERLGNHPCQMPESLLERIIQVSSNEGDTVLDPFGGTGTTSAIAKRLKRHFITMELSEEYYNLILKRLDGKVAEIKRDAKVKPEQQMTLLDMV